MFVSQEGKKIPSVTFHTRQGDQWVDVTSKELFNNKTVVVFSLPGAFTPTCSSSHLPRYNELAEVFKQFGVDAILCVSVNDTFVMNTWKVDQNAENVSLRAVTGRSTVPQVFIGGRHIGGSEELEAFLTI
ncbi:redoxin family protein [Dickeya oryzae]|uniref:redoxin family protein n=1 Tax=Dickeya oryzae TaxID=1240404 RepID=UPI001AEC744D|nr:redoxin family protein [Dickeya oryzae]MBP2846796.1 redoxin family protein [Dickeya oryzae]